MPLIDDDRVAYILFTSGTTGTPKGVIQSRYNIKQHIKNYINEIRLSDNDNVLQIASFTFDAAIIDTYATLLSGATLYVANLKNNTINQIINIISDNKITVYHSTPTVFRLLDEQIKTETNLVKSIRKIIFGGEKVYGKDLTRVKYLFDENALFVNLYGSTECSFSMCYKVLCKDISKENVVPIGNPVNNISVYLVDENKNIVENEGELVIVSNLTALKYWNDDNSNIKNYDEKRRIYYTGDIVSINANGTYQYRGRRDLQVKINGIRIELTDINSYLIQMPLVKEAYTCVDAQNGINMIISFVRLENNENVYTVAQIKKYLADRIPSYMIPNIIYIRTEEFPFNRHGKIDKTKLLLSVKSKKISSKDMEGRNEIDNIESTIIGIWADILGIDSDAVFNSDFFEMGGTSLSALKILTKVNSIYDSSITLKQFFFNPSIESLIEKVRLLEDYKHKGREFIVKDEIANSEYLLTAAQKRIYFSEVLANNTPIYNISHAYKISYNEINVESFKNAICQLLSKHEMLRSFLVQKDGELYFKISNEIKSIISQCFEYNEIGGVNINEKLENNSIKAFDLFSGPLARFYLYKLSDNSWVFQFVIHHIIADAWSLSLLFEDFWNLYFNKDTNDMEETLTYKEYSLLCKREPFESNEESKRFWENELESIERLELYTNRKVKSKNNLYEGDSISVKLENKIDEKINAICKTYKVTQSMVLLTALRVLLYKYARQNSITIGVPVSCRTNYKLNRTIGCFVNTLPLHLNIVSNATFKELLLKEKELDLNALEHQEFPIESLEQYKNSEQGQALFNIVFSMQNAGTEKLQTNSKFSYEGYYFEKVDIQRKFNKFFDLVISVLPEYDGTNIIFEYSSAIFDKDYISNLSKHYLYIISQCLDNMEAQIKSYQLLTEPERNSLVTKSNQLINNPPFPINKTIIEYFEECVLKYPKKVAISHNGEDYSYEYINSKANQLANRIISNGIKQSGCIAILLPRSVEQIIAILAILKSNNAYLPLDHNHPDERLKWIISNSKAQLIITNNDLVDRIHHMNESNTILLYSKDTCLEYSENNIGNYSSSDSLAYIIYTSGTTGTPKGVAVMNRNIINIFFHNPHEYDFNSNDVWIMFHSYCFDVSVWEMYGALLFGGKLILVDDFDVKDSSAFLDVVCENEVTILCQTPTAFQNLAFCISKRHPNLSLRYIIFAGEELLPIKLKDFNKDYPEVKLINMYGITETTIHTTYKKLSKRDINLNISNIGKAMNGYSLYLVDKDYNLLPSGIVGELLVGGFGVTAGYYNNYKLTSDRYIVNPINDNERVYKSGDLARQLKNGEYEYLGRIDNQIQLHGFRIELSEIEKAILKYSDVREVKVVLRDKVDDKYLDAYVVAKSPIDTKKLREHVAKLVPYYMIPSNFIQLDKFPMTVNGKVDKAKLPELNRIIRNTSNRTMTSVEREIAEIWESVLGVKDINPSDDFFYLGGNSIRAMKAAFLSNNKFTLVDLFKYSILEDLAEHIERNEFNKKYRLVDVLSRTNELLEPVKRDDTIVICVPYGAGDVSDFRDLAKELKKINNSYRVLGIELSGRGRCFDDEKGIDDIVDEVYSEYIERYNKGEKIIIYGHCVGCAGAIALARKFENNNIEIKNVIIGGTFLPSKVDSTDMDPWKDTSDQEIRRILMQSGWDSTSVDEEALSLILYNFREDVRKYKKYFLEYGVSAIKTNIHYFIGNRDLFTNDEMQNSCANSGIVEIEGDHYFIKKNAAEVARHINEL